MSVFKLQHFSDTHAEINTTQATLRLMDQHEHHARVHTNDAVSNRFEQDYSYLASYDFMFAMGNHDCILLYGTEHWVETGYVWTK